MPTEGAINTRMWINNRRPSSGASPDRVLLLDLSRGARCFIVCPSSSFRQTFSFSPANSPLQQLRERIGFGASSLVVTALPTGSIKRSGFIVRFFMPAAKPLLRFLSCNWILPYLFGLIRLCSIYQSPFIGFTVFVIDFLSTLILKTIFLSGHFKEENKITLTFHGFRVSLLLFYWISVHHNSNVVLIKFWFTFKKRASPVRSSSLQLRQCFKLLEWILVSRVHGVRLEFSGNRAIARLILPGLSFFLRDFTSS